MRLKLLIICLLGFFLLVPPFIVNAQTKGTIKCGDVVDGEIISGQSKKVTIEGSFQITVDDYQLDVPAGTHVDLTIAPLGNTFNVAAVLVNSGGNDVVKLNDVPEGQPEKFIDFPIGSSRQILRILGVKPGFVGVGTNTYFFYSLDNVAGHAGSYFGAYEITLQCAARNSSNSQTNNAAPNSTENKGPTPPSKGFPGLAPVDFANVASIPLQDGANNGAISPNGNDILGFTFSGKANNGVDLSFKRVSGNLNLGLVVIYSDNKAVFQSSLITSDTLSTHFTLPADGTYTIGVFKIDLLPPDKPQATAFQIQAQVK